MKENPTTELLERFREEFGELGNLFFLPNDSTPRFRERKDIEEWLTTHTLSKKEVARVIEGMMEELSTVNEVAIILNMDDRDTALKVGRNAALTDLKKALGLE